MKSILEKQNKKGQVMAVVGGTLMGFFVLIFMILALLYGMASLNPKSLFATDSAGYNATQDLEQNFTLGASKVGGAIPTVVAVLVVVLVLAGIAILILYARRMQQGGGVGDTL